MLVGLAFFFLRGAFLAQEIVNFLLHVRGEAGIVVEHVLKARGQMDLGALAARKMIEGLFGKRGRAVLHGAGKAVFFARDFGEFLQGIEIDLDTRDRAVGQRHAAVRRAGLDADLADALELFASLVQLFAVTVHVGLELLDRAVLPAHLADLSADGNGNPLGLQAAQVGGQFSGDPTVVLLLRAHGRPAEIDQSRAVDIDVKEFRFDRFFDEIFKRADFRLRIFGEILRARLEMIALNEERSGKAFFDRRGHHGMRVLVRPLKRVADLRARDLEDHRADLIAQRGAKDGARHVVGQAPNIDRRNGEPAALAPADRLVKTLDRRRVYAESFGALSDDVARGLLDLGVFMEDAVENQSVDGLAAQFILVQHAHPAVKLDNALKALFHIFQSLISHGRSFRSEELCRLT